VQRYQRDLLLCNHGLKALDSSLCSIATAFILLFTERPFYSKGLMAVMDSSEYLEEAREIPGNVI
jgi:hypothetical protein